MKASSSSATARSAPPGRRAKWILLATATALALGVSELAVRLLLPQPLVIGDSLYAPDAELGWVNQSDYRGRLTNVVDFDTAVRTNALGLRGAAPDGRRPALLGLGDSFMFGYGAEEGTTILDHAARVAGVAPVNGGVNGYDLCQAVDLGVRLLDRAALAVDALALSVCLANDEWDAGGGRGRMEIRHGFFVEPGSSFDPNSLGRRLRHPLYAHSHLVRFLRFSPISEWLSRQLLGKESIDRRILQAMLDGYRREPPENIARGSAASAACVAKLAALGAARGVPVVAVLISDEIEIVPGQLARVAAAAGLEGDAFDIDGPRRRFAAMFAAAGVPVVDPLEELQAAARRGVPMNFTRDRHFTPDGNRIVGEALGRALASELARRRLPEPAEPAPAAP